MSRSRLALTSACICGMLLIIAGFLHAFLCEWGEWASSSPRQMPLLRLGNYGLFARHEGNYPRWAMLTVGGLMPLMLALWAVWLYFTVAPFHPWRWRAVRPHANRFRDSEYERLIAARVPAPACVAELGLRLPCTADDVKAAFRRRSKTLHPDRGGDVRQFIALHRSYEEALRFVAGRPVMAAAAAPSVAIDPSEVAVLDAAGRKRARAARRLAATGRAMATIACLALAGAIAGSSRWVVMYHTDNLEEWVAVGAGAIEFKSLPADAGPRAEERQAPGGDGLPAGWSLEARTQPLRWWPRAAEAEQGAIVTVPLWILLAAIAAPTALMWRRR